MNDVVIIPAQSSNLRVYSAMQSASITGEKGQSKGQLSAAIAVMAAIEATTRRIPVGGAGFLDSFQSEPRISLELLENSVFPFASDAALLYRRGSTFVDGLAVLDDCLFLQRA